MIKLIEWFSASLLRRKRRKVGVITPDDTEFDQKPIYVFTKEDKAKTRRCFQQHVRSKFRKDGIIFDDVGRKTICGLA